MIASFVRIACAVNVSIEVEHPVHLTPSGAFAVGAIWQDSTVLGGVGDMRSRVLQQVEMLTKHFVVVWSAQNS